MCFTTDARPPLPPIRGAALDTRDLTLNARDGAPFAFAGIWERWGPRHDPAAATPFLPMLQALGVTITTGGPPAPLGDDVDAVVVSTATPDDDPTVVAARERDVPGLHRAGARGARRSNAAPRRAPPAPPAHSIRH